MDGSNPSAAGPAAGSGGRWVTIAELDGMTQASLVVNFLRAHGFTALAWQEGAGQAIGLTVGYLGTAHVMAPPQEAEEARRFLAEVAAEAQQAADSEADGDDASDAALSPAMRAALGVTAVAVSGLAAPLALGLAAALSRESDAAEGTPLACSHCDAALLLSAEALDLGWYVCPECRKAAVILNAVTCPHCRAELELTEEELTRQAFDCAACGRQVRMT